MALDASKLRERVLIIGTRLLSDPRVGKVMADPRVMRLAMGAMGAPQKMRQAVQRRSRQVAARFDLATAADVVALRGTVGALEKQVATLTARLAARERAE